MARTNEVLSKIAILEMRRFASRCCILFIFKPRFSITRYTSLNPWKNKRSSCANLEIADYLMI